ncbi:transporter substrate-binding domain-containing protein [Jiella mangrovi]|uniref:Transporter substrate-binding domain-containing protein n=1 Tax=Jiella mangrovi TaxID=2821407 RepID=A0ABS4BJZ3_9HYPH|nr:transporter substrate-binding domain-containing protein [Jiella mangrovi]MBP0616867.1 transporter substrate-binding domain-containing protein [Jiella mangrovi]
MKILNLVLAAGGLAGALAATSLPATAQTPQEIKDRGTVNIGMLVDFPPFGILNTEGKPDGYDADVAKLLAEDFGVKVNLVPVTGPNRIPYLLSNRIDFLVASLGITPERAERVDFSQPYAGIEISVVGEKGLDIPDAAALAGQSVGVARASTQDTSLTKVAPEGTNIQRFDDDASAVQALISGQVPLIGASNTVIAQIQKLRPDTYDKKFDLAQQVQGVAVKPGSDELLKEINQYLTEAKKDGKLNAIHEKWLGQPLPDFIADDTAPRVDGKPASK